MIRIYNKKEIGILRRGGKILAEIMEKLKKEVKLGVTTEYLNKVAEDLVFSAGVQSSFKGYNSFPAALCTSINEEIVHSVPSGRQLKQGDILSLDLGIKFKGYCTDMAVTVPIGYINKQVKKLIWVTEEALGLGIEQAQSGNFLGDIGYIIQKHAKKNGFNVVKDLVGHGVGKNVHEEPVIPNYGRQRTGPELVQGMVLALEPMVVIGDWHIEKARDGFGYKTADNSLSCHFEHTIVITKNSAEVLTKG